MTDNNQQTNNPVPVEQGNPPPEPAPQESKKSKMGWTGSDDVAR